MNNFTPGICGQFVLMHGFQHLPIDSFFAGLQGTNNCNTFDNRNSSEDACVWSGKQRYFDTQSNWGNWSSFSYWARGLYDFLYLVLTNVCLEQYSAKLLKKPDQCRAVYACSHLFWVDDQDNMKDGERYFIFYIYSLSQLVWHWNLRNKINLL